MLVHPVVKLKKQLVELKDSLEKITADVSNNKNEIVKEQSFEGAATLREIEKQLQNVIHHIEHELKQLEHIKV